MIEETFLNLVEQYQEQIYQSVGPVKSNAFRAKKRLREMLRNLIEEVNR